MPELKKEEKVRGQWKKLTASCYCKVPEDIDAKLIVRSKKAGLINAIRYWLADKLEPGFTGETEVYQDNVSLQVQEGT